MERNEEDFSVAEDVEESVRRSAKSDTGRVETSRKRKRNHRSPTTSESEHSDDLRRRKHGRRTHRKRQARLEEENLRLLALLSRRERVPMDLIKFDPKTTDATGWVKMVDEWIRRYNPDDYEIVQHLAKAFKDEAAQWFTGMDPSGKSWKGRKLKAWLNERKTVDETAAQLTGLSYSAQNRFVRNIFVRESPKSLQEAMAYLDGRTTDFHQPRASSRAPGPHTKTLAPRDGKSHRFDIECYNCERKGHRKAECRSALQTQRGSYSRVIKELDGRGLGSKKPITCYNCKEEGHIAPSCPKKNEKVVRLCHSTSTENTLKLADGKVLTFIFDSGSDCSLVTESLAERLPGKRQVVCMRLRGLGNGYVDCREMISVCAELNSINVEIDLYVVPDESLSTKIILGKELLANGISDTLDGTIVKFAKLHKFVGACVATTNFDTVDCDVEEMRESLLKLLRLHAEHMSVDTPRIRVTSGSFEIRLKDENKIVQRRPYKLGILERESVRHMVNKMLEAGIVRESRSPFSSPIILVKKKDGSDRLCVDFRELNANTVADRYPLPLIQDQLDRLCELHRKLWIGWQS
ncbi:uncharacterized protein LOC124178255 [Neodiprion fabricii]|uniref:uncharacterized protein LOC124178255 n=1 Tax=Neodiprion fabricii TaxID=2872261 RepID=UPI001ED93038|nr:uncharacterized protein LOC124178255 [Neodiprion fabricii]